MALREFVELSPSWGNNCAWECSLSRTLVESRYKTIFVRGIIRSRRAHREFNHESNFPTVVDDESEDRYFSFVRSTIMRQ